MCARITSVGGMTMLSKAVDVIFEKKPLGFKFVWSLQGSQHQHVVQTEKCLQACAAARHRTKLR